MEKTEKKKELIKYRNLVLATLDYYLESEELRVKTDDYDSHNNYRELKKKTVIHFEKGRLTILKQWFRDLTEMQIETRDLKFNSYLKQKTNYDIDIFSSFFKIIDRIIEKGKITTDNQFYNVKIMIDQLCQENKINEDKIEILNSLVFDYENKKNRKPNSKQ